MLQLPTQVYMAFLFSILDILLNVQHCWYVYWVAPKRKRQALEQQNASNAALSDSSTEQQPAGPADSTHAKKQPNLLSESQQQSPESVKHVQLIQRQADEPVQPSEEHSTSQQQPHAFPQADATTSSNPMDGPPAVHHLRAVSAGQLVAHLLGSIP